MMDYPKDKIILLFDGYCNLCVREVDYLIRRDKKKKFLFGSLQSQAGQELLKKHNLKTKNFDSFVVIKGDKVFKKSRAGLELICAMGGLWKIMAVFFIVPSFIRDKVYDFIAKNRYRWFGSRKSCRVATEDEKNQFLK